ncbi:hypothetical protein [Nocardia tengchongensis]
MKITRIARVSMGIAGITAAVAASALFPATASATFGISTITAGAGGDPGAYTITNTTISQTTADTTALLWVYDRLLDSNGYPVSERLLGGAPITTSTTQFVWYPTALGNHQISSVERTPDGQVLSWGGGSVNVSVLPKTTGPADATPPSGPQTSNGVSISASVVNPNQTYTVSMGSVPSGAVVHFMDGQADLGQATVTNGTATLQWTPTTVGYHAITATSPGLTFSTDGLWVEVVNTPVVKPGSGGNGGGGSTGSADSIPVIGGLLKALGL